jgi:hypothetical protein
LFEVYDEVLSSDSDAHSHAQNVAELVCKSRGALLVVYDENRFVSHHDDTVFLEKHEPVGRYSRSADYFFCESLKRRVSTYSF